ncbi:MAG: hypothetical protein KF892_24010 [Rhizobacter sp.]|nr:hypothetical protein [Rhizobacter sp.]
MTEDEYIASGTIRSSASLQQLLETLSSCGHPAKLGESSQFKGGQYVRIKHGEARITAENIDPATYLLRGESGQPGELELLCEAVSNALKSAHIIHSIELYDEDEILKNKYAHEADA